MKTSNRTLMYRGLISAGVAGLVLALAAVGFWLYKESSRPPEICFPSIHYDFGKLAEGIKVRHVFLLRNTGGKTLIIKDAKSTCDCTTVRLASKSVQPRGAADFEVTMDTTMKLGPITKVILVSSNDPVHPQVKISVAANVDPHQGIATEGPSMLFSAKCSSCHVQRGIGKSGEDLYLADCAMCHGFRADGATGPTLVGPNLEDKVVRARMRKVIADGGTTPAMPGFIKQAGGPLTSDQIDSLVQYLRWRRSIR